MKLIWSPLATAKVQEEAEYIAKERPGAALGWAEGIFEAAEPLARFPNQGRIVPELGKPEYRELIHDGYRILYRVDRDRIVILTVRHGRRLLDLSEIPAVATARSGS